MEDGNHGEYRPRPGEFVRTGTSFIRAADMANGQVLFDSAEHINEDARGRIRKGIGAPGDVLLSHKGTVGKVALVPTSCPPFVCSPQTTYWRSLDATRLDHRFLFCILRSREFQAQLESRQNETDMAAYVSLTAQRALTIPVPPISEQRAIARILGALDDKIELSRKTNETLEAMARALFKAWFVDFDPVRARVAGRRPEGMAETTAALFPGSFEESVLGPVPKGWRVGRLEDLVELRRGHDLPASARREGPVPIVSSGGITGAHDTVKVKAPGIVTGRYGTLGKVFLMVDDYWPLNTTLYSSDMKGNDPVYIFHALGGVEFEKYSDKGAVPGINRNHLHMEPMLLPPVAAQQAFGALVGAFRSSAQALARQSTSLAEIRDALLPKLMSGDLRIPEAECSVAAVT